MNRLTLILIVLFGCTNSSNVTDQFEIQGDACAVHSDQTACRADSGCAWYAYGRPCPANDSTCPSGVCQSASSGGGGGGGGTGSGTASCVCFNGGVCFEQTGGTPQQLGSTPQPVPLPIQCAQVPDQGDRCALIQNQGHCTASPTVTGLCLCDNGIR